MKNNNLLRFNNLFVLLLLAAGTLISCSNSVGGDDHDHEEPEGFRLKISGQTAVEQLPDLTMTGSLSLSEGEETDLITVYFIDHDGDEFQPEDEEYSLGLSVDPEGIVEVEQHEEDGKWSFHLHGETEGQTTLTLQLLHGTHSDFTREISVSVRAGL